MAKRFTDTEKWGDVWFRELSPTHKLAWNYLCDCCDCAGVLELDSRLAEFVIGEAVDFEALIDLAEGRIERISNGRLWLVKFVEFQYGQLSEESKPHQAVIRRLKKAGLLARVTEGYAKGSATLKEKVKEKEKGRGECRGGKPFEPPTVAHVADYCRERGNQVDPQAFVDFYESKGWMVGHNRMKSWKACVRTWERREKIKTGPGQKFDEHSTIEAGVGRGW